jgi:hypothetical protein
MYDAPYPSSFHGLLLPCYTIHAEATALLYSVTSSSAILTQSWTWHNLLALTPETPPPFIEHKPRVYVTTSFERCWRLCSKLPYRLP